MKTNSRTRQMTLTAMFAAVATLLAYFEFPLPFMPPFLKVDLSGVPILIGGFLFGPVSAVVMVLIKNLVHLLSSSSAGVGQLADFLVMSSFAVTASLMYRKHKTKKMAIWGCILGVVAITVVGILANKYLLIPFYANGMGMPIEAIVEMCGAVNPLIGSLDTYLLLGVGPFNLIKGLIISLVTILVYKKISVVLKSEFHPVAQSKAAVQASRTSDVK